MEMTVIVHEQSVYWTAKNEDVVGRASMVAKSQKKSSSTFSN